MRKTALMLARLSLAAALGGCGRTGIATTGDPLPDAASLGIRPGKWRTTITVTDLRTSGMPAPKPAPQTLTTCMTPEQARKGPADLLKDAKMDCTANSSNFAGGRFAMDMTCTLPTGTMTARTSGSYTPTTMTTDAEVTMTGKVAMSQRMHSEATRIGDCD